MSVEGFTPPPIRYAEMAPRAPEGAIDLDALLVGEGEIEIDIGFGRGMSLYERARAAPEVRLLGIEIKSKWATKVQERLEQLGLGNVRIFCGDARELLARSGPAGCVSRVFVHFPDPWWKKRHAKRRVLGEALLEEIARLLRPGGQLFVQTDVPDRAELYLETLRAHAAFRLLGAEGLLASNPFGSISNRERRAIDDGLPFFRILAERR